MNSIGCFRGERHCKNNVGQPIFLSDAKMKSKRENSHPKVALMLRERGKSILFRLIQVIYNYTGYNIWSLRKSLHENL